MSYRPFSTDTFRMNEQKITDIGCIAIDCNFPLNPSQENRLRIRSQGEVSIVTFGKVHTDQADCGVS